jgi:hypothetical protein
MTMSERCLIPYNHQISAAKFIAQTRFGETARPRNVVHRVQKCSWIQVVVCEKVRRILENENFTRAISLAKGA